MKKRGEKNIFIGGSLYSLLLYLLVAKSDDIEQTFFFVSISINHINFVALRIKF